MGKAYLILSKLEERSNGVVNASKMLGVPYSSSYASYKNGSRKIPKYIRFAVEDLMRLSNIEFEELLNKRTQNDSL